MATYSLLRDSKVSLAALKDASLQTRAALEVLKREDNPASLVEAIALRAIANHLEIAMPHLCEEINKKNRRSTLRKAVAFKQKNPHLEFSPKIVIDFFNMNYNWAIPAIKKCLLDGSIAEAKKILSLMPKEKQTDILYKVAREFRSRFILEELKIIATLFSDNDGKIEFLLSIAGECTSGNRTDDAIEFLDQASQLNLNKTDRQSRDVNYYMIISIRLGIAEIFTRIGDLDSTKPFTIKTNNLIFKISDCHCRLELFLCLSQRLKDLSDLYGNDHQSAIELLQEANIALDQADQIAFLLTWHLMDDFIQNERSSVSEKLKHHRDAINHSLTLRKNVLISMSLLLPAIFYYQK